MLISVDFWKSMHGFAMDSRTRAASCFGPKSQFWKAQRDIEVKNEHQEHPLSVYRLRLRISP